MRLRSTRRMLPSLVGLAVVLGVACSEVVTGGDDPNVSEAADPVTSSCTASISCKNGSASCSASGPAPPAEAPPLVARNARTVRAVRATTLSVALQGAQRLLVMPTTPPARYTANDDRDPARCRATTSLQRLGLKINLGRVRSRGTIVVLPRPDAPVTMRILRAIAAAYV